MERKYTDKQGQYLAFIYYYGKIHGRPPAETDLQRLRRYSTIGAPDDPYARSQRLIERTPGQARSIRLLLPREEMPDLE